MSPGYAAHTQVALSSNAVPAAPASRAERAEDAVPGSETDNLGADPVHNSDSLVTEDDRWREGQVTGHDRQVAVTHPRGCDSDDYVTRCRRYWNHIFDYERLIFCHENGCAHVLAPILSMFGMVGALGDDLEPDARSE
jgi:hypothetical protein